MRGVLLSAGVVVLLGFAGCGGDEFEGEPAGTGGQAGTDGGSSGQAGSSGAAGQAGSSGAAGEAGSGPSAEDACKSYASAYCNRLKTCAPALIQITYGSLDMCKQRLEPVCVEAVSLPDSTKTPAWTATCAEKLADFSCDSLVVRSYPPECVPAPGARGEGTACGEEGQCATSYCKYEEADGCGVCRNKSSADGVCAVDADCKPGLYCGKELKCLPYGELEASCDDSNLCKPGLSCVGAKLQQKGLCKTAGAGGKPCQGNAETMPACDALQGLYCALGTCKEVAYVGAGAACGVITGVGFGVCTASAKCNPNAALGTCMAAAADGAPCNNETGPYCMPLAQCVEGICKAPVLSACQ